MIWNGTTAASPKEVVGDALIADLIGGTTDRMQLHGGHSLKMRLRSRLSFTWAGRKVLGQATNDAVGLRSPFAGWMPEPLALTLF